MTRISRIKAKIEQVEKILGEIKNELEILAKKTQENTKQQKKLSISEEELKAEYEKLYHQFEATNSELIIKEFINSKTKAYLKVFCKANSLTIDPSKASKEKIADEVIQWMRQRKAITKKLI